MFRKLKLIVDPRDTIEEHVQRFPTDEKDRRICIHDNYVSHLDNETALTTFEMDESRLGELLGTRELFGLYMHQMRARRILARQ